MTNKQLNKLGKEIMDMEKDYDMNIGPLEARAKSRVKYQLIAGIYKSQVLISRNIHDFCGFEKVYIDGGQFDYFRCGGPIKMEIIESSFSQADLAEDWHYHSYKPFILNLQDVRIVPKEERQDRTTLEWKKRNLTWGTCGPDGQEKKKFYHLCELETGHLENILVTQNLNETYTEVIKSILNDRESRK